jgi:hypothetical protein
MLRHVFGLKGDVRNNVHYYDESHVLYPAGQNIVIFNLETRTQFKISAVVDTYALIVHHYSVPVGISVG